MRAFLGALRRDGKSLQPGILSKAFGHLCAYPQLLFQSQQDSVLLQSMTDEAMQTGNCILDTTDLTIVGDVEIFNRAELCGELNLTGNETDLQILAFAYRKWAEGCVKRINGDFAFAIWDKTSLTLFCGRDPLGQVPLFYYIDSSICLVANWMQLLSCFSIASEYDEEWIVNTLLVNAKSPDGTVFSKVKRLNPGHILKVTADAIHIEEYWNISGSACDQDISYSDAVKGIRLRLENAVASRLKGDAKMGIELSGGIDSVSIAALIQQTQTENKLHAAFTNVLPKAYKGKMGEFHDEWDTAARMATDLQIPLHVGIDGYLLNTIESLERVLDVCGYPCPPVFTASQEATYAKANEKDVSLLFSGFGGNEVVTQFAAGRYKYNLVRQGNIGGLLRDFKRYGLTWPRAVIRTGHFCVSYLRNAEGKTYRENVDRLWEFTPLNEYWRRRSKAQFYPTSYFPPNHTVEERCLYNIFHPATNLRLEMGYCFTSVYGLRYRHPLLDVKLVEYYFGLPAKWKAHDITGRGLFRAAMRGKVDDDIILQTKPYSTSTFPFYKIRFEKDFEMMKSHCLSLPAGRRIFDFIDQGKLSEFVFTDDFWGRYAHFVLRMTMMFDLFFEGRKKAVLYEL